MMTFFKRITQGFHLHFPLFTQKVTMSENQRAPAPTQPPYPGAYPPPYPPVPMAPYPPPYSIPTPPPPPPKKNHVPSEKRTKIHTIFLYNLAFNLSFEQLNRFCRQYGEISLLIYPLSKKGMAFCTYFDLRDAEKAVKEMVTQQLNGRPIKTNFAFKPPAHSKRDPKEICSTILVKSSRGAKTEITYDEIKDIMSAFGEIRESEDRGDGEWVVKYFDLRHAQKCSEEQMVKFKDEELNMEFLIQNEDLGDDVIETSPPPPHQHGHHLPSRHWSYAHGQPYPYPQPYPYAPYPYPPYPYPPPVPGQYPPQPPPIPAASSLPPSALPPLQAAQPQPQEQAQAPPSASLPLQPAPAQDQPILDTSAAASSSTAPPIQSSAAPSIAVPSSLVSSITPSVGLASSSIAAVGSTEQQNKPAAAAAAEVSSLAQLQSLFQFDE
ncbi:hypothetical protein TRFO_04108 [Tritrichomonas foetus]|uniref:RRM domain-containing protein n=1 Tax=Tritrichomonas foetus TaxID=1144522 RepID=A0A1J4KMM0_9EUKA|nr:hypothetical protein TRFO_04108 [Tritrichomonas foetus]|eukprot:OHT10621.1 hypothetical protein TRFO_04108 [Tritrichomonas foetus]